ncbi:MAG: hypothetical protein IPO16_14960 [Saprospiraceae bacterium]|nr:hypothetical protein [Saprospiraceae bacterium]
MQQHYLSNTLDIKHLAKILFDNRHDPDYQQNQKMLQILAKNGIKIPKRTFDSHIEDVKLEIAKLHDLNAQESAKVNAKADLEKLFPQIDYVLFLKKVMDGEPDSQNRYPNFKDMLQAGKQASDFFGWNEAQKNKHEISGDQQFMEHFLNGKFKVVAENPLPEKTFKEL